MLTQEDLKAISLLLNPINKRLDNIEKDISDLKSDVANIKEDIAEIKEDCEVTREVTNKLGEWVDFYFHEDRPYPLDEEEIKKFKDALKIAE